MITKNLKYFFIGPLSFIVLLGLYLFFIFTPSIPQFEIYPNSEVLDKITCGQCDLTTGQNCSDFFSMGITRSLMSHLPRTTMPVWHSRSFLTMHKLRWLYSDEDLKNLYYSVGFPGEEKSLKNVCLKRYSKNCDKLSDVEILDISLYSRAPGYYLKHPDASPEYRANVISNCKLKI